MKTMLGMLQTDRDLFGREYKTTIQAPMRWKQIESVCGDGGWVGGKPKPQYQCFLPKSCFQPPPPSNAYISDGVLVYGLSYSQFLSI